jgi:hypothetical protein
MRNAFFLPAFAATSLLACGKSAVGFTVAQLR